MRHPIIILNWNGLLDTQECVRSVLNSEETDYMLYLIDNGSDGEDIGLLRAEFGDYEHIQVLQNDSNLGFTKAHNKCFEEHILPSDHEFVILLNNDTTVEKGWLSSLIRTAKEHNAHLVGSKMINYYERDKMDNAGHRMINTGEIVAVGVGEPPSKYNTVSENMGTCAGATLYSVPMLRDIGTFDAYFETGYEDAELGVRAKLLGYKSIMDPNSIVYHKGSASIKKIISLDYVLNIQSAVWYAYFKLMPIGVIIVSLPFLLFKLLAIVVVDILFGRWLFLKALYRSLAKVLVKERAELRRARSSFHGRSDILSTFKVLRMQEFFLWFDLKRLWNDVILRNKPMLQKELEN